MCSCKAWWSGKHDGGEFVAAMRYGVPFARYALALLLLLSGPAFADGFTCAPITSSSEATALDELEEVVITGRDVKAGKKDLQAWLRRLAGNYTYEGHVDLCGRNNAKDQRPVTGNAVCVGSISTPTVTCTINVKWPEARGENGRPVLGGTSHLLPALVSYSLEARHNSNPAGEAAFRDLIRTGIPGFLPTGYWGVIFTQVDNRGIVEWGSGMVLGDTFISKEPCVGVDTNGPCQKITRVTARPNSTGISMSVDINIDNQRVLRQVFLLHRL